MKHWKLLLIIILGLSLRLYGLNFDQGTHLHPDERFMTIVAETVKLGDLNPYTNGFSFYVYGTFPLFIVRGLAELFNQTGYDQIFMVGRLISALADVGTIFLTYLLALNIFRKKSFALWSAFFYAVSVLPIQQSHFFTVDALTVFLTTATLYFFLKFLDKRKLSQIMLCGILLGLTLSSKISILLLLPILLAVLIWRKEYLSLLIFAAVSALSFRIFQPFAFDGVFHLSSLFLRNISDASKMITGDVDYPPNIQWAYTKPLSHPFVNIFFWGLGPVITSLSLIGIITSTIKLFKKFNLKIFLLLVITGIIFGYQGIQLAKYMRYFYPVYPLLCVFAAVTIMNAKTLIFRSRWGVPTGAPQEKLMSSVIIAISLIWPLMFISIYSRPHTRVAASEWIYQNIPTDSKLTSEEWDDPLPLPIGNKKYAVLPTQPYAQESIEKWQLFSEQLKKTDYIILSSNRVYGSVPRLPQRYPVTSLYYKLLFDGKLGFKKVAEFTSYPEFKILNLKFKIDDSSSEESFSVYDHPKVLIFKKENFNEALLRPLLDTQLINSSHYVNPKDTNKLLTTPSF